MKIRIKWALFLAVFLFTTGGVIFISYNGIFSKSLNFETNNTQVANIDGMDIAVKLQNVYRNIAKSVMPAVVSINVESVQVVQNPYSQFFNDPFFRQFFGDQGGGGNNMPKEFKQKLQALGSGFIITKDGYLFSNAHVVKDATKIVVILADNRQFTAKLIGLDPETDIALLKINANNLPVVYLGDSGEVQVGDSVMAIGNPFGLSGTFTAGVVSAVGRQGMTSGFQKFIQTDAAVNPGNSGGPLVNLKGQVVAINAAIKTQSGGYEGISFAIPINIAKNIAEQLLSTGKIQRGYLGINIMPVDSPTRKMLGLQENEGVMVSKVEKGSSAEKAGIKKGDIVTKVNGELVNNPDDLQSDIGGIKPGTVVNLEIFRDKKKMELNAKLSERPSETTNINPKQQGEENPSTESYEYLGATFGPAAQSILDDNGADHGVIVKDIKDDSILSGVLDSGVIVSSINGTEIKNLEDLKAFAGNNKNTKSFTFLIVYNGFMYYKSVEK